MDGSVTSTSAPSSPIRLQGLPRHKRPGFRQIWTPNVLLTLLVHFLLAFHTSAFNAMTFVFLPTPRAPENSRRGFFHFSGGLGLPSSVSSCNGNYRGHRPPVADLRIPSRPISSRDLELFPHIFTVFTGCVYSDAVLGDHPSVPMASLVCLHGCGWTSGYFSDVCSSCCYHSCE